jgi:adenylosuccinate synthase
MAVPAHAALQLEAAQVAKADCTQGQYAYTTDASTITGEAGTHLLGNAFMD